MYIKSSAKIAFSSALLGAFILFGSGLSGGADLERFERGHFIVFHENKSLANKLSWKAEYHYKRIVGHFGVKGFRPWEGADKCPIYLYKTKEDYREGTGAPDWSVGQANYTDFRFSSYEDAPNLMNSTLPHEMTHMLFHIFMDKRGVPLWLDEGMAQFEEDDVGISRRRKKAIKKYVRKGRHFGIRELMGIRTLRRLTDEEVDIFYVQAASVVDHLITGNIKANYGRFLSSLKSGASVEEALKSSYQWKYKNGINDLEERWLDFVRGRY